MEDRCCMTIDEAIRERHTVRVYKKTPIPADVAKQLNERIKAINEGLDVFMSLVTNDSSALNAAVRIGITKNVNNYIVLSGKNEPDLEEKLGYGGADLMLFAQTLGLNTWWVSGTFNKGKARENGGIPGSNLIKGIIIIVELNRLVPGDRGDKVLPEVVVLFQILRHLRTLRIRLLPDFRSFIGTALLVQNEVGSSDQFHINHGLLYRLKCYVFLSFLCSCHWFSPFLL